MTEEEMGKLNIAVFDESDLYQFQEKMLIIFAICVGFRGNKEHTLLKRSQIGSGVFPPNHPTYPNKEWWGLIKFSSDKTHKLSLAHNHTREMHEGVAKFPVLSEDGISGEVNKDVGGAIKRYCTLLDQGLPVPDKIDRRFYRKVLKSGLSYAPLYPLGKKTVRLGFKSGFKRMGISNWDGLRPHSGRGVFCTAANDPTVPLAYGVGAARHMSATTFVGYQTNGITGGSHLLRAILNTASGGLGAATQKSVEVNVELEGDEERKKQEGQKKIVEDVAVGSREATEDVSSFPKKIELPAVHDDTTTATGCMSHSGAKKNVLCLDEDDMESVTSHLTTPTVASSANQNRYSVFTQMQLDEVQVDMARLEAIERGERKSPSPHPTYFKSNPTTRMSHQVTPSERSYFNESCGQSVSGYSYSSRSFEQPRKPSARELELINMRQRIQEYERRARVRHMQDREMENMTRYDSYPYWNSSDEHRSLYQSSMEEEEENDDRLDVIRRRDRGGKKPVKKGRRRSYYKY